MKAKKEKKLNQIKRNFKKTQNSKKTNLKIPF